MVLINGLSTNNTRNISSVSFRGHNLSSNTKGEKTYKFFLPKVMFDDAKIVLKRFQLDKNGNIDTDIDYSAKVLNIPAGSGVIEVNPQDIELNEDEVLGYRFVVDGKDYIDKHRSINTESGIFNLADMLSTDVLETPKSIYHIIPSSFNPKLKKAQYTNALEEQVISDDKTARMNHFMKFDTSLGDIIEKIPHIKELGFRRILSTPIFGQDNLSSHGYWTTNPFQITERYGTIKDFEKLQIELFKNSMGYIADGAFTNEGFMGVHIRDILRHGKESPFINWFELFNYPSKNIKIGILPDSPKAYENFDIRVVNSPVIWSVDKHGNPTERFGEPNRNYDPRKETYIQVYDKRLTSLEQLQKDEVFKNYDIRNTQNPDDISDWMDSVQPYAFPVKASQIIAKAKRAKNDNTHQPKEFLMKWEHFEISNAKDSAAVLLWTGNKDIPKLRFVLPASKKQQLIENANTVYDGQMLVNEAEKATNEVQNYIVSVGKFWTNRTAKVLRHYIASQLGQYQYKTPEEFCVGLTQLSGQNLPEEAKRITYREIQNALNDEHEMINTLQTPITVKDALKEYPLEALEVSDDITAIFAYPNFKKVYEKTLSPAFADFTTKLLKQLDTKNLPYGKFFENGRLTHNGAKTLQLVSDDIKRFLLLKSLSSKLLSEDIFSENKSALERIKNISAANLGIGSNNTEASIHKLISFMHYNFSRISPNEIKYLSDYIENKLKYITPESIKVADLVINNTEAGLNWRIDAAKDIADIEGFFAKENTIQESWGEVFSFWKKFNDGIGLYNKHAYKIGEFTDTDASYSETHAGMQNSGDIEQKIVEQGGFTTQSNYSYMFSMLQRYYSAMAEYNSDINADASSLLWKQLIDGWEGTPGYLFSGNKNNIAFSHVAVGNHDKTRVAQTFAMNAMLVYKNYRAWGDAGQEIRKELLNSALHKSKYYKYIQNNDFDRLFQSVSQRNLAKMAAFTDALRQALSEKQVPNADKILSDYTAVLDELTSKDNSNEDRFFYKNFEATYSEILKLTNDDTARILAQIQPAVHMAYTRPALQRLAELARLMVALPGNPTLYAGDDLLETGGEEKSRNFAVQNRNRLHWEYQNSAEYSHIKALQEELKRIYNLRNDKNLSCLVNGDTIMLQKQGGEYGRNVMGLYRYNEHNDAIILLHNIGFNSYRHFSPNHPVKIEKINLSATADGRAGLPADKKLKEGTRFVNALDETQTFVVNAFGDIYNEEYKKPITLNNSVVILKRIND